MSLAALDGDLLEAFVAFADTLNFTHAAKRIGLSQPALHDRVSRLSEALGRPLYVKQGRAVVLTGHGVRVAAYARESMERAARFVDGLDGVAPEQVVLAAGRGAYLYLLGPALRACAAQGVALTLRTLGGPSAAKAVRSGEAHLAFGVYDVVHPELVAVDVLTTGTCAALSDLHPLARKKGLRLRDLRDERLILAPQGQRHRDFVGRAFAGVGTSPLEPVEADGWPLMLAFAAAGQGVAIVNASCRPPPGCVLRPLPELGTVTYRLLRRRTAAPHGGVEALAACILGTI